MHVVDVRIATDNSRLGITTFRNNKMTPVGGKNCERSLICINYWFQNSKKCLDYFFRGYSGKMRLRGPPNIGTFGLINMATFLTFVLLLFVGIRKLKFSKRPQNNFLINKITNFLTMTKRSNPFIEDFMPQSKVHVGIKQFNNNKDRLQSVYEKTLELLFSGAKKCTTPNVEDHADMAASNKKDNMKQLFIGKDGSLLHSSNITPAKEAPVPQCSCGGSKDTSCGYCEKALCTACQRLCSECDRCYCSHCSLPGYEGAEVCVSCYN